MRSDYLGHVDAQYDLALEKCSGVLVNKAGRADHVDGYGLFTGSLNRAMKFASEELLEFWEKHPRLSLEDYEIMWLSGHEQTTQGV